MTSKWTPISVEDNTDGELVLFADGEIRNDVDLYLTPEQYEQMKQGYMCCRCFEVVESAFPEACGLPGCDGYPQGFPMRERQREVMESEMKDEYQSPKRETSSLLWTPKGST